MGNTTSGIWQTCARGLRFICVASAMALSPWHAAPAAAQQPLYLEDFSQVSDQGFGDFHNSMARASQWWNGKLYVGTSRDFACAQQAIIRIYNPFKPYPPPDPTLTCASDPNDLSMQAEIWAWTPDGGNGSWERVYQSPLSVPIPGTTKLVAREVGFRDMAIFTEPDGTEALYVTGITARGYIAGLPPPTLLRTTDGLNFAPVPQDPGTVLGDLGFIEGINISSLNRVASFNNKLYLIVGGDFGHGFLFEATDPAGGNDNFQRVSPAGMTLTYMQEFNGALYLAQGAQAVPGNPPYKVLKMNTSAPPYTFTTIVDGTRLPISKIGDSSQSVATMHTVGNQLWVATNQPVELVRINPNDTWDLFLGEPRLTTSGTWKYPLTGLGDSFDWFFNIHIHRIQDHDGYLYTASNDLSNGFPMNSEAGYNELFGKRYGFDVHRTRNGYYFYPVTFGGFQESDPGGANNWFNFTGRVANSTPYGLFFGTGNNQYGLQMWRATGGAAVVAPAERLENERIFGGVVLSWDPSPSAVKYRIFKAQYGYYWQVGVPWYAGGITYPRAFTEIGTTTDTNYTDTTPLGLWSHYYVVAESDTGALSNPSNVTRAPSHANAVNFSYLKATVNQMAANGEMTPEVQAAIIAQLNQAQLTVILGGLPDAKTQLDALRAAIPFAPIAAWRVEDLDVLLTKLTRRIELARLGKLSVFSVWF